MLKARIHSLGFLFDLVVMLMLLDVQVTQYQEYLLAAQVGMPAASPSGKQALALATYAPATSRL